MLGLPGPVFPLLSHSLHSSRSFSPGLVGGSAPPCAWPSFPLCSQVLAMGPRTPLAPVVPSNFCLALLVCPGASPHFLSLRCPGLGLDRTALNPEDWRPKAQVTGIRVENASGAFFQQYQEGICPPVLSRRQFLGSVCSHIGRSPFNWQSWPGLRFLI